MDLDPTQELMIRVQAALEDLPADALGRDPRTGYPYLMGLRAEVARWLAAPPARAVSDQVAKALEALEQAICRWPDVLGAKAVLAGTRIPVWKIQDLAREGGFARVHAAYPDLMRVSVAAALAYAALDPEGIEADRRAHDEAVAAGERMATG